MSGAGRRSVALAAVLATALLTAVPFPAGRVAADPWVINNADGTADAVWNFTNPSDYTLSDTTISGGVASLRPQVGWWNSTSAADFSGPDSETNVDYATTPGDVTLASTSGTPTLLTLQPGAAGEDAWLERNSPGTNHGADTTLVLDGRNPQSRPVLRFDLSATPAGAVIDSASLSLYQSAGIGNTFVATVYRVTAAWNEAQVTWDDRLTGTAWNAAGGDYDAFVVDQRTLDNTAGWRTWNVTQLVDLWYRGRVPNDGVLLNAPNPGANSDKTFYASDYVIDPSLRPKLDVRYRILGATGEYVSKVGGPASLATWQTISWNTTARSRLTDEFSVPPLDPKWTWTNPAPSYDVDTTTPGHLYARSATLVDFSGATFSGHVLANEVVGDFNATMKFDSDPTASGQKAGLMVLVNGRNWFALQKTNIAGIVNWQARRTADAVSADTNSAAGNPIPAWVRIVRAGNTFNAFTSADGAAWTLLTSYAPTVEYPLQVRVGVLVADGLSGTAHTVNVDYLRIDLGTDAAVTLQTRIGNTNPVDGTWSGWSAAYAIPSGSAMSGVSQYVEFRLAFSVTYPEHTAVISDVNVSWGNYLAPGAVETNDLAPGDVSEWGAFTVVQALNGQTITYAYSLDSGGAWTAVVPPANLQSVSIATGMIRFRASMSTTDTTVTPTLSEMRLSYRHRLDHFHVTASAVATAGSAFPVTVTAKDAANVTIVGWTGTVTLAARLSDGVTPGGGILGTTSLSITSGGTETLPTETYTKAEVIRILVFAGAPTGLSDLVTVSPGSLDHIVVIPDNVTLLLLDSQGFTAQGYDAWNNSIAGLAYSWTVLGGIGTLNTTVGDAVTLTTNPPEANGTVRAFVGPIAASAAVRVVNGTRPWIILSSPGAGAHLTGTVAISYVNSTDAVSVRFEHDAGSGWTLIGVEGVLDGAFSWDTTTAADFAGGSLRAIVTNNRTVTNVTAVSPIDVDNTPPTILLGSATDNQATGGTITLAYVAAADVVGVDFSYFDGSWHPIGTDATIDGTFVWTPGVPINGVTVRAVARDEVGLTVSNEAQGIGTRIVGTSPPAIASIPDIRVRAGQAYDLNLTFYVSDPDTQRSALGLSVSDPSNVTASPGTYPSLRITFAAAAAYVVTLWVSDGTDVAWTLLQITASSEYPPSAASLPLVTFDEDTTDVNALNAPLTTYFTDADGDALAFTVLGATLLTGRVNADETLDLWAGPDAYGSELLRIRAIDPSGGFAEAAFLATVRPVNDAPVLATLADIRMEAGTSTTLDLAPYVTDVDNPQSQISVTTDSPYVTVNGLVLTIAFPADSTSADVTITVSDGLATDAQALRVIIASSWWTSPYMLAPIPITAAVVVAMFVKRQRWRPAKAFLVDERGQLLREFTLDASCQVSYREVYEAGALDAVEKPIRVSKYNAQTVRGDALAVVLLAQGPVSLDQVEFARELLVNVQDRFEESVKQRLEEAHAYETELDGVADRLEDARTKFDARTKEFAAMMEALTASRTKVAQESSDISAKLADLDRREARVKEDRTAIDGMAVEVGDLRASLEKREKSVGERETDLDARAEEVQGRETRLHPWENDLTSREKTLADREAKVEALETEASRKTAEAERLLRAADEKEAAAAEEKAALAEAREAFQSERETFEARSTQILAIDARLTEQSRSLEAREAKIGPQTIELTERESAVSDRESQVKTATDAATAKAKETEALLQGIEEREAVLGRERKALEEGRGAFEAERVSFDAHAGEVRALEARLTGQAKDLEGREARVAPIEATLGARESATAGKEASLNERAGQLDEQQQRLAEQARSLEERETSLAEERAGIEKIRNGFDSAQRELETRATDVQTLEATLAAKGRDLEAREAHIAPIQATLNDRERAVAEREASLQALSTELDDRDEQSASQVASLKDREDALAAETTRSDEARAAVDRAQRDVETHAARFEEEARRRQDDLNAQGKALGEQQLKLAKEVESFDAVRQERMEWISAKEIDLEAREQSLQEKETAVRAQAEENAKRLADLASREETLEVEGDKVEKSRTELETRKADADKLAKSLDAKSAQLREDEATKAEEFRTWQTTIESEQAMLRSQKEAFEKEMEDLRTTWAGRMMRVQQREEDVASREGKIRTDIEWVARNEEDLKRREKALEDGMKAAASLRAEAETRRKEIEAAAFDLQTRERSMREEAAKHADELVRRSQAVDAEEMRQKEARAAFDQELTTRRADLKASEADLARRTEALEARHAELTGTDARLTSLSKSLADQEERLSREKTELQDLTQDLGRRQLELGQARQRFEEESMRARAEAESIRQSLAQREAELQAGEERLQRESATLQDKLGTKAQELAAREKSIVARESETRAEEHDLDARLREVESRERQAQAHEAELAAQTSALAKRQSDINGQAASLDETTKRFTREEAEKRKEWESLKVALESQESQLQADAQTQLAELTLRAGDLERRERSASATTAQLEVERARLADAAKAQAAKDAEAAAAWARSEKRFAELKGMDGDLLRQRQMFESEKASWAAHRSDELKQLEMTRDAAGEQASQAERLIEEAQRRANLAGEAEKASQRRSEEIATAQKQLDTRRAEIERGEQSIQAQMSQMKETVRQITARESDVQARAKDQEVREARLGSAAQDGARVAEELKARQASLDAEAGRLAKLAAGAEGRRADAETRMKTAETKAAELVQRERVLTTELQRSENLMEDLGRKDGELKSREKGLATFEAAIAKREENLAEKDKELRGGLEALERMRQDLEDRLAKADEDGRTAATAREEAQVLKGEAERAKAHADELQTEVAKNMKFLQKKAVDVLDREETIRERETKVEDAEKALEARAEIVENKGRALDAERDELLEKMSRMQTETGKLRERLANAENGAKPSAALEEWQKDIETRVKIIQKKAFDLLDREEKLRKKEEDLRAKAEELGTTL